MTNLDKRRVIVTGGAGFIGSNLIHLLLAETQCEVFNVDKLTYAGNLESLSSVEGHPNYHFRQVDIVDEAAVERLIRSIAPDAIMHLAAESHVDRSIDGPGAFIQTNIVGTFNLLNSSRDFWNDLGAAEKDRFRFHHISTDEVYGALKAEDSAFTEATSYDPHSPYSASKAASDHLVRAWNITYGMPVLITNCSNNYGPYQFPEKLIPVVILRAIQGRSIPVYGDGKNVRDWLYVEDHARALMRVLESGRPGETYNIGGDNEMQNIDLVNALCEILDQEMPISSNDRLTDVQRETLGSYRELIEFVTDRPGHDLRYAIDASKVNSELGWAPREEANSGFRKTVKWYLENERWWSRILSGDYQIERIGLGSK